MDELKGYGPEVLAEDRMAIMNNIIDVQQKIYYHQECIIAAYEEVGYFIVSCIHVNVKKYYLYLITNYIVERFINNMATHRKTIFNSIIGS